MTDKCPLCGSKGKQLREKTGAEILSLYKSYLGKSFPEDKFKVPLHAVIQEYKCQDDSLVWYSPADLGDGDFYQALADLHPWYYKPDTWDKNACLKHLANLGVDWVVEVGAGDGGLLRRLQKFIPIAIGVEINPDSLNNARESGLVMCHPEKLYEKPQGTGILCMLQTIEHLQDPLGELQKYIAHYYPKYIAISAPCSEAMLALTSDPLSWPPHHATAWCAQAFAKIGSEISYKVVLCDYSKLTFDYYHTMNAREKSARIPGIAFFPRNRMGSFLFNLGQKLKIKRLCYDHSIFCILEKV
jgi:hypothetical protein